MIISAPFRDSNPRLHMIGAMVGIGLFVLFAALWRVQVMNSEHYGGRERAQSLRRIRIPSARGEIVDRNGIVLAQNRPSYDIVVYLEELNRASKRQDIVRVAAASFGALSQTLQMPVTLSERDVRIHYQRRRPIPLPVWRDVKPEQVAAFAERASSLPGADLVVMPVREYTQGALASHVLGYVGKAEENADEELEHYYYYQPDSIGKQGIEKTCDDFLRGSPGGRTIRVSPGGTMVEDLGEKAAERGNRVALTLDARIQRIAERALANAPLPAGKTLSGAVVVLDPRNGEVLAMASAPSFDPNVFNPGTPDAVITALMTDKVRSPMLNRAIGARYAPGSTFKCVTLLAGLETGAISPNDTVTCTGSLQIGSWHRPFRCWNDRGHGTVNAFAAIKESCDVWFYQEGMKTGVDAITKVAAEMGFGQTTGLDLGNDREGFVPSPAWKRTQRGERWWDGDTAQLSIGQSFLLVTPLQMACMASTFANRGISWRPYIVGRVESPDGKPVYQGRPELRGKLTATPQHVETVRRAMLGAVHDADGTAHRAAVSGLSIAGKTGTAEYETPQGRINRAWFIGFAPYDDPEVAVAVVLEDADSGGHTAAPVAGAIFAGVFEKSVDNTATAGGGYAD